MIPLKGETLSALAGAIRVLLFRQQGFAFFAEDAGAAWRSFFALFLAAPAFYLQVTDRPPTLGQPAPDVYFLAIWALTYILLWAAFPVVLLTLAAGREFEPRVPRYIQVSNWAAVPAIYANMLAGQLLGSNELLSLAVVLWLLINQWWILRETLKIRPGLAVGLVFLAEMINFLLFIWAVARSGPVQVALQS